jgi:hypothetical protein
VCVYLVIIAVSRKQYATINDGVITPTPAFFGFPGPMGHALLEQRRLWALARASNARVLLRKS